MKLQTCNFGPVFVTLLCSLSYKSCNFNFWSYKVATSDEKDEYDFCRQNGQKMFQNSPRKNSFARELFQFQTQGNFWIPILILSSSLHYDLSNSFRVTRKVSMIALQEETDQSKKTVDPPKRFPVAIISACCDMVTILGRPFMSLSQFVHFSQTRLKDDSIDEEEAHKIIFQRYCLAFSDKDQILFQSFVIIHLKIMSGDLTDEDFK